jgi:transposase-like protein
MSKLEGLDRLFDGRHFDREIILLCVRWYLRYKLSLRDLVEMMAERGVSLAHAPKEVPVGHDDPALGPALHARIRQTLEPAWHAHRTVVACRRNVPEDPG